MKNKSISFACRLGLHCRHAVKFERFERTEHNGFERYHVLETTMRCCKCPTPDKIYTSRPGGTPWFSVKKEGDYGWRP